MSRLRVLLVLAVIAATGCVTPVIPLPPPEVTDLALEIKDAQQGLISVSGKANSTYANAYVTVINVRTGNGVVTRTSSVDGSFKTPVLTAQDGDPVDLWVKWHEVEETTYTRQLRVDYSKGLVPR